MSRVTVDLPEPVRLRIAALAASQGFTLEQFVAVAAMEKLASLRTVEHLREEAAKGRREDFASYLAAVPSREPDEADRMPE
jgi:hypothetical protein